jgi:Protein of unknown function (DUF2442)
MVSRDEFAGAAERTELARSNYPKAVSARYDLRLGRVFVRLNSGIDVGFAPRDTEGLEHARASQLRRIEVSPSGFGLHFPAVDADVYLPSLLRGFRGSQKWMAARLGAAGGKARSAAKSTAARRNGKLGGRPAKARKDARTSATA